MKILIVLFVLLLPFLFYQCETKDNSGVDFQGKLKQFKNENAQAILINGKQNELAEIILPECFDKDYSKISISNDYNFSCFSSKVFFTVDAISKNKINYYAEYFNDEKIKSKDGINIMRAYCLETRAFNLYEKSKSIHSILTTNEGEAMLLGSVKGKSYRNEEELYYQYGVVEGEKNYFILQAIVSEENAKYFHPDIIQIFRNFKLNL